MENHDHRRPPAPRRQRKKEFGVVDEHQVRTGGVLG